MSDICRICLGKCCQPPIFLGQKDVEKLRKAGKQFNYKKAKNAGFDLVSDGKCPFLKIGKGCTLDRDLKPIDCVLYPLVFKIKEDGSIEYYLNKGCPYFKDVPNDWIEETKKWIQTKMDEWSSQEKDAYYKRQQEKLAVIILNGAIKLLEPKRN